MVLGAKVYPKRSRNWSKAVPESIVPVLQPEFVPIEPALVDIHRLLEEWLDRQLNWIKSYFDELTENMMETG